MSKPIAFSLGSSAAALAAIAFWLGVAHGRAERPDLGVAPADAVRILEEAPYVVPAGRQLVITALGTRLYTITEIGLQVDEQARGSVLGDGTPDQRCPFHALASPGQGVRVYGGLVEDDVFALGYLRPAPCAQAPGAERDG